jgi:hypothetical protein
MNSIDVNDLLGTAVIIKVTLNGDYTNVSKVELASEVNAAAAPAQAFTGFGG